jgi:hypothetical protein
MAFMLALAVLCLIGGISAVVAAVRDARGSLPTVLGYDTRRPLP